jgi:ribosomal-protein-alanine N-acetyltransferase
VVAVTTMIRRMDSGDVTPVADLEAKIFPQPWPPSVFAEEVERSDRIYLVAERGGFVVGYAGLLRVEEDAHIVTLAVDPPARGHGLGKLLMLRLIKAALEGGAVNLTLEVRVSNEAARRLYEEFGFEPVGVRRNYYRDEDALIMWAVDADSDEYKTRLDSIAEGAP